MLSVHNSDGETPDEPIILAGTPTGRRTADALLRDLLHLALHYSGAHRGALLLVEDDTLRTLASSSREGNRADQLPSSLLQHVRLCGEPVSIDDVDAAHNFETDPYGKAGPARCALALPVACRDELVGVLYLEHRDEPGRFPRARITVLEQFVAQAAISLDNARLAARLEDQERAIGEQVLARGP